LTFTIKTPQKDAQGNYQYDSNGNQLFTTRTDGPYTGSGSATLNVRNGKFEVKIKPEDNFPLFSGDTHGYRNKLGIGEDAAILVFPEAGSEDTVEFYTATSSDFWISGTSFEAGSIAKQGTIYVYACINGSTEPDGPETIGITVVEPQGVRQVKLTPVVTGNGWIVPIPNPDKKLYLPNYCSVAMCVVSYLNPTDVSFNKILKV
jgi:hypothetical protein